MYRWNLDNIKEKQKYVQDRLKNDSLDDNERKKLELTLLSYYGIISNSGGIHITQIANLDILRSKGKGFSLIHNTKYKQIKEKHSIKEFAISDDYLSFLILICNNLSNKYIEMGNLDKVDIAEKEIVDISRKFYESFDEEMSDIATRALSPEKSFVNFSDTFNPAYEGAFGITFHDYLFNESYFTVKKSSTL